jgi:signal peptidase I
MKLLHNLRWHLGKKTLLSVWLVGILAAVIGVVAGRTFIGSFYVVDGLSMMPLFEPGTHVRAIPISTPIERGDIVVVDDRRHEYAVKRVVGLPGETVHLWRGQVFIDRHMLREPYLAKNIYTIPFDRQGVFVLGEHQYFVLGDNRPRSLDSRAYGPVEEDQIRQRVNLPENNPRPCFVPYTLPDAGKTMIRRMPPQSGTVASNFEPGKRVQPLLGTGEVQLSN